MFNVFQFFLMILTFACVWVYVWGGFIPAKQTSTRGHCNSHLSAILLSCLCWVWVWYATWSYSAALLSTVVATCFSQRKLKLHLNSFHHCPGLGSFSLPRDCTGICKPNKAFLLLFSMKTSKSSYVLYSIADALDVVYPCKALRYIFLYTSTIV